MTRYAEYSDVVDKLDDRLLIRLTDDQGTGSPDQSVIETYLDDAASRIDAKIGMRYQLPISTPPTALKVWNVDLAVYLLLGRRQDAPGDIWQSRYEDVMSDLNAVADGKRTLGLEDPEDTGNRQPTSYCAADRVYTRDKMGSW